MTDAAQTWTIGSEGELIKRARIKDEDEIDEMVLNGGHLFETNNDLNILHLVAYMGNTDLCNRLVQLCAADVFEPGSSGINFKTFKYFMTATATFTMNNGTKKHFTPVHLAVLARQVDVLATMSYWQRQYDDVGFTEALGIPCNQCERPAALAGSMYGKYDEISELVHVLKDAAGAEDSEKQKEETQGLVGEIEALVKKLETSDAVCKSVSCA